jgi:predicted Zn-dependent peptidase
MRHNHEIPSKPELTRLGTGSMVLCDFMPERESVSVGVWLRAGSRYESARRNGISHLLEHMLFKGTGSRSSREISRKIEGVGGSLNGFTSEECTCYWAKIRKTHLKMALELLLDMVFHPRLDPGDLEKEKGVVKEEIKMYRDLPGQHCQQTLQELMWPCQPLGRPILGTEKSLEKISRSDLANYRDRYYTPSRLAVAVCGNARLEEVLPAVESSGTRPSRRKAAAFPAAAYNRSRQRVHLEERESAQAYFSLGVEGLARDHPRIYTLKLLNIILGANMSSRLFQEIREKRGWAYAIHSELCQYRETGALTVTAGILPDTLVPSLKLVTRELLRLTREEPSRRELRRAQEYLWGQTALSLEQTAARMIWRGEKLITRETVVDPRRLREKVFKVTPADIISQARRIFRGRKFCLSVLGPYPPEDSLIRRLSGIITL